MCADRQREIISSRGNSLLIDVTIFLTMTLFFSEGPVGFAVFASLHLGGFCWQVVVIGWGVCSDKDLLIDEELFLNVKLSLSEGPGHFAVYACLRLRGFVCKWLLLACDIDNAEFSSTFLEREAESLRRSRALRSLRLSTSSWFYLQLVVISLGVYIDDAESSSRSRSFCNFYKVAGEVGTSLYFGLSGTTHPALCL